jgi:SAM-dependent methyltransferase
MTAANEAEHEDWNGENGQRWIADADRRDLVLHRVSGALLDAARLQPGEAVLDLGCGCGATTLAAAHSVGPSGSVLGVDISEVMLSVAHRRIDESGLDNVDVLAADAQTHAFGPGRSDIAISRFGTMFFDDPVAAFANIGGALRPGGRLCIATWQPLDANDWLIVPGAALLAHGSLPELGGGRPGMFAQSDPATVTDVLLRAGLTEISVEAATVPLRLGADPDDATDYLTDSGVGRAVLATVPESERSVALASVRDALREHQSEHGVVLTGGILITSAVKA